MVENALYETDWTPRLRRAVATALRAISRFGRDGLDRMLLIFGLFSLGSGIPRNVLAKTGITLEVLESEIAKNEPIANQFRWKGVILDESVKRCFTRAHQYAKEAKHTYIGTDHLLLALLDDAGDPAAEFLGRYLDSQRTSRDSPRNKWQLMFISLLNLFRTI